MSTMPTISFRCHFNKKEYNDEARRDAFVFKGTLHIIEDINDILETIEENI